MASIETTERHTTAGHDQAAANLERTSVLDLMVMRVRLRAHRRAAWLAHLWDRPIADASSLFDATLQLCLDDRDTPDAELAWFDRAEDVQPLNEKLWRVEQALAGEAGAALQQLTEMFRLSQPETDLLQTCLALAADPALGTV